ncbi:MAG: LemA family protein [Lachnospiraceae bacterium]|nr:LemA family protein [Lachnospiraceae bacterium]
MKKGLIVVIAVIALIVVAAVGSYNSLVNKQTNVEEQEANINTQLQRRADLIPNLVTCVKSYAEHETEVFTAVTEAREKLLSAGSLSEKAEADAEMTSALNRLVAIAESYPELKADTVYVDLMDELAGTENRIAYARQDYNSAVSTYNKAIKTFPAVIFAKMFGFEKAEMFESTEAANEVPQVDL